MKALIQKDFYVLWKQMKIFPLFMLVIMVDSGIFGSVFILVWVSMLPYTAMAYDERCRWNRLAAMMPYSTRDIVLSKYVLGWLCAGGAAVVVLAFRAVAQFARLPLESANPTGVLLALCASVCVLSVTLPMMFRFGVEKGRLGMFLLIFLVCGGAGAASSAAAADAAGGFPLPPMALVLAPAAAAALTAASIPLSVRLYGRQQGGAS